MPSFAGTRPSGVLEDAHVEDIEASFSGQTTSKDPPLLLKLTFLGMQKPLLAQMPGRPLRIESTAQLRAPRRRLDQNAVTLHVAESITLVLIDLAGVFEPMIDLIHSEMNEPAVQICGQNLANRHCQEFRVRAAIVDPKEVPDGTTQ